MQEIQLTFQIHAKIGGFRENHTIRFYFTASPKTNGVMSMMTSGAVYICAALPAYS